MDQFRVLRLVIASPGDVKPEREIIPRVVDEVNRNIARRFSGRARLQPCRPEPQNVWALAPAGQT